MSVDPAGRARDARVARAAVAVRALRAILQPPGCLCKRRRRLRALSAVGCRGGAICAAAASSRRWRSTDSACCRREKLRGAAAAAYVVASSLNNTTRWLRQRTHVGVQNAATCGAPAAVVVAWFNFGLYGGAHSRVKIQTRRAQGEGGEERRG